MNNLKEIMNQLRKDLNLSEPEFDDTCRVWRIEGDNLMVFFRTEESEWYNKKHLKSDNLVFANTRDTFNKWSQAYLIDYIPHNWDEYNTLVQSLKIMQSREHRELCDRCFDNIRAIDIIKRESELNKIKSDLDYYENLVKVVKEFTK